MEAARGQKHPSEAKIIYAYVTMQGIATTSLK